MVISGTRPVGGMQNDQSSMDVQSIEQKIQQLQQQIKKIKENDKLPPDEKEKKIRQIKEKIERLEEQKQRLQQKKRQDDSSPEDSGEQGYSGASPDPAMGNYINTIV